MKKSAQYDAIIIGGSYAGLSAGLSLGRSMRTILIIDGGEPCNKTSPFAHNFLTNDCSRPQTIKAKAREQVLLYPLVSFQEGLVANVVKGDDLFEVITEEGTSFTAKKVLFATGVKDTLPITEGFKECWGLSILHCPYCHGYECKNQKIGVLGNGDMGFELAKIISQWAGSLTLYTNGTSTLTPKEVQKLNKHDILVVENVIEKFEHENGYLEKLHFKDMPPEELDILFTQLPFKQHCDIPEKLGCELTEKCFIKVSHGMETSVSGIFAAGDCLTLFRSIANAVAQGNKAGAAINKQLIEEAFAD